MDLNEAIRHAIDGNAILFMGSGFSYKAKNLESKSPMTGRAFARHLYELCGVDTQSRSRVPMLLGRQSARRRFGPS